MPEVPQGRPDQWCSETINCSVDTPVVSLDLKKRVGRYPYRPAPMLKTSTVCRGFAKKVPVFGAGTAVSHDVT
ncbi:hypothetical protein N9U66_01300 [Synechococcus sp. AH-736-M20]|nr:hypothetical protein [Synechococcus sp. AH-736-M20]